MSGNIVFSQFLREVRFLFCQTGAESNSTRSFLARTYPTMKKNNPQIPIMIRGAAGTHPRVYARYGWFYSIYLIFYNLLRLEDPNYVNLKLRLTKNEKIDRGLERSVSLAGLSEKEIENKVAKITQM